MDTPADDTPRCTNCRSLLRDHEAGRYACTRCQHRADDNLLALAGPVTYQGGGRERQVVSGFYAALAGALTPGSGNGGPSVSGSRSAPLPLRLQPLSLMARGGVVTILQTWAEDWASYGHASPAGGGTLQQQCDEAVATLRFNLDWAARSHPAFAEFAGELEHIVRACWAQISGDRPPRRVTVACPCGGTLRVTLDTPGARCSSCGTQYGHSEVLQLPMADRAAA